MKWAVRLTWVQCQVGEAHSRTACSRPHWQDWVERRGHGWQVPRWQGVSQRCRSHPSSRPQARPHAQVLLLQRWGRAGLWPQWQTACTVFGHGGQGPTHILPLIEIFLKYMTKLIFQTCLQRVFPLFYQFENLRLWPQIRFWFYFKCFQEHGII